MCKLVINESKMKLSSCTTMWLIIGFVIYTNAYSCKICCKTNVTLTEQSHSRDSCADSLSLRQLVDYNTIAEEESPDNCLSREFVFQAGYHQVYLYTNESEQRKSLTFWNVSSVIIRGKEQKNTTINCINQFSIVFMNISTIKIKSIHFQSCTISFAIAIPFTSIDIKESKFTDSGMSFQDMNPNRYDGKTIANNITLIIEDTIIEKYSGALRSILYFDSELCSTTFSGALFNITQKNSVIRYNNRSFIELPCRDVSFWSSITLTGLNHFIHNNGSIINASFHCNVTFSRAEVYIVNNTESSAPIILNGSKILFEHSHVEFNYNHGSLCGGITAQFSNIIFSENITIQFSNNYGLNGGALSLNSATALVFSTTNSPISINFIYNKAAQRGGALYVNDSVSFSTGIRSIFEFNCNLSWVKLTFCNNSALLGGNQIYGGWVDWFVDDNTNVTRYAHDTIEKIFDFACSDNDSDIASQPIRICLCTQSYPNCSLTNYTIEVYGYSVSLDLVAVGQRNTPVSSYVKARLSGESSELEFTEDKWLHLWPRIESLERTCTKITYKIYSDRETLHLEPDLKYCGLKGDKSHGDVLLIANDSITIEALTLFQQFSIEVNSKSCPLGFILHEIDRNCICQQSLLSRGLTCDLVNSKINRKKNQWIGLIRQNSTNLNANTEVIVHQPCPYDYCRQDSDSLSINLENQDVVCAFNRSGILCGRCKTNFSRVLGSSKCKKCTNNFMLIAIVLSWLALGLLFVLFLMVLDLTVSVGTINGLTFYANIIQAQYFTFFSPKISNSFMSRFIAWLNLDQGVELCLYDGLDDYSITWLELFYPLYIWLIAIVLIVSSNYSKFVSKVTGKNAVQVLATLFLVSYTRLLRLIIDVFSFTKITYPDGYEHNVWLVDGNVQYLAGKHVPLFLVTVLFVLLSLPYTLILLTIQLLHKISHLRVFFWVQRLKPFLDAYTGPFKPQHRYWTGLLLLARIVLLVIFSVNQSSDAPANLLAIIVVSFALVGWSLCAKCVYESPLNNLLEAMFLCNLGITSAAVLYNKQNMAAIKISTSIAFIMLIFIIMHHVQRQILRIKLGSKLKNKFVSILKRKYTANSSVLDDRCRDQHAVSSTTVELKEPLLEYEPEL